MPRNHAPRRALSGLLAPVFAVAALLLASCGEAAPQLTTAGDGAVEATSSSPATASRQAAPAFRLTLFDGHDFDLQAHLSRDGRPVLLNLWASWCPPCLEEMPYLEAAARRHPEVLFLGVAVRDDPTEAAATVAELGLTYPLGADADGTLDAAFPAPGLPATFLIDTDGSLIGVVYGALQPADIDDLVTTYLAG